MYHGHLFFQIHRDYYQHVQGSGSKQANIATTGTFKSDQASSKALLNPPNMSNTDLKAPKLQKPPTQPALSQSKAHPDPIAYDYNAAVVPDKVIEEFVEQFEALQINEKRFFPEKRVVFRNPNAVNAPKHDTLPIDAYREEILERVYKYPVTVLNGETG